MAEVIRTRAAVLYKPKTAVVIEDVDVHPPKAGEVRVKIAATGVCHSDYNVVDGFRTTATLPTVLGHEGSGVVESVGEGVTGVNAGDHVIFAIRPMCGKCRYCSSGRPNLCNGTSAPPGRMPDGTARIYKRSGEPLYHGTSTFCGYAVVPDYVVVKVRDDVPLDRCAIVGCAVITGVGAVVNRARVETGSTVAVWGCGGVGLNAVQGAVIAGASRIIAVDMNPFKLEMARKLGATDAVDASREDPVKRVLQITDGGVDYAFEVIGNVKTTRQAFDSLCAGGTCVTVGAPPEGIDVPIPMRPLFLDRAIIGSSAGSGRPRVDFAWLLELYRSGRLKLDELISKRRPLEEVNEAFRDMADGKVARTLLVP
ncbi:MAG: Zn-dependent alcohol dehydrogenase [Chloroflexi bacterium]|nr:Zn-dependent alcohol dehydrogenase [Chloroflexota bacterium]